MQANNMPVEILQALCKDIPNLPEDDLRELRRALLTDRAWRTPNGVSVEWDENPAWVTEILSINERLKTF